MPASAIITPNGPFDLPLSLRAAASFLPLAGTIPRSLKLAVLLADQPAVVEIRQARKAPPVIEASAMMSIPRHRLVELADGSHRATSTCLNAIGPASPRKGGIEMMNSSVSEARRKPLSSRERARFERYIAQIFTRLGMDL